jgi:hypothetical protein
VRKAFAPVPLLLILLAAGGVSAQTGTVRGRIVDGGGGVLREPVVVSLASFGETGGSWNEEDGREGFLFDNLPSGEENPYLLHATYLGVVYNSRFHLHPGQDTTLVFEVYDTTSVLAGIGVEELDIELSLAEDRVRIDQVYRVLNRTDPPKTVVGSGAGTFRVSLPLPVAETPELVLAVSRGIMPVRRDPIPTDDPKSAAIDYPMRPGVTAVAASYELPYPGELRFEVTAPYDIPELLVLAPSDMRLEGDRLTAAHGGSEGVGVYTAGKVGAGERIAFRATGGSPAPSTVEPSSDAPGRVVTAPAPFTEIRIPLLLILGAALFGSLAVAWRFSSGKKR